MFKLLFRGLLAAAAVAPAGIAAAASGGGIEIKASVLAEQRVQARDGSTQIALVAPARITPGDHVVYRLAFRNLGARSASGVVIANPVPAHVEYAGAAANSPAPELSVDGRTFGPLATLVVRTAAGGNRAAQAADVRVVRWRLPQPVPAGGEGQVAFRAVLK